MTLDRFRSVADRALRPFVSGAVALGLTPDGVSVLAFLLAVAAGVVYLVAGGTQTVAGVAVTGPPALYLAGALLVFVNGWLDLLDGALARELDTASSAGDLLDHVLDRYADIVIVAGLAGGVGEYALGLVAVTGVLMTSYLGTQSQAVGLDRVYGGLVGRADRLALVGVVTAVTAFVPRPVAGLTLVGWLLVVFAVVGHVTALQRFYHAMRALS
ncbi:MAG: CDP-alcohol phosphatidyltransferase family protein [Haloarculaceae archaeon]